MTDGEDIKRIQPLPGITQGDDPDDEKEEVKKEDKGKVGEKGED